MRVPTGEAPNLVVTNGKGRLFVQTLLPGEREGAARQRRGPLPLRRARLSAGQEHRAGPECRIEVSPSQPAAADYFLHVLTATDAGTQSVPRATARVGANEITVTVGDTRIGFATDRVGGWIERGKKRVPLANAVHAEGGNE